MLEVDGLRSYRHPVRVDFGDVTLMAIVGDTGSGKSSLLEAITYGLYAASTWSGQPGDLIADGTQTMRVQLTFLAGGQRWRATRSMSRTGYPPPVHRLECLDEPGRRFDGRTQVNDEVERIVGLDYRGFLRSVILPQGRFADLLLATDADRTRILKNLFRVDELEQARQEASHVLERLDPAHADLRERRAGLLALRYLDPAGLHPGLSEHRPGVPDPPQGEVRHRGRGHRQPVEIAECVERHPPPPSSLGPPASLVADRPQGQIGNRPALAGSGKLSRKRHKGLEGR